MIREILFKAKRKDNGEWVYGSLIIAEGSVVYIIRSKSKAFIPKGESIICSAECYEINPETLCQYTGLTDKNGRKIWENDIAECNKRKEECGLYKVIWRKEYADFGVVPISNTCIERYPIGFSYGKTLHGRDYKKVGNIFDNPELLEVE